jgi:hypothetical protein
LKDE